MMGALRVLSKMVPAVAGPLGTPRALPPMRTGLKTRSTCGDRVVSQYASWLLVDSGALAIGLGPS